MSFVADRSRNIFAAALAVALAVALPPGARAQTSELPAYKPREKISDTLRSWGSTEMAALLQAWERGFRAFHPEVRFTDTLKGTETAQAALYTGVADFGLMDREILSLERHVLLRRKHVYPLAIAVATGSADTADRCPALAVLVHRDNPLAKLTLRQLDGIFGEQRSGAWDDQFRWHPEFARGAGENLRTWGQLGLTGEWADKPIQVYGYPVTNYSPKPGPMLFFRAQAFRGGDMWNPNLREFETGMQIAAALGADRFGIAYAALTDRTPQVKPLALAGADGKNFVEPTKANIASRVYPLARSVYISVDPTRLAEPGVREFLSYVLSREGQQVAGREGGFLPLTAEAAQVERAKLTASHTLAH